MRRVKTVGVGWAKTGTKTLRQCLEVLGYRHQSTRLDLVSLLDGGRAKLVEMAAQWDSFDDWPWLLLYRELDTAFPGSRFILTVRDSEAWLRSYRNMLARWPASEEATERRRVLYGLPFPDVTNEQLVVRYERHNREVQAWFAGRPEALLVVDWAKAQGWPELCRFLGHQVDPDLSFPHANRGHYEPANG
jgi:hypothetical protein